MLAVVMVMSRRTAPVALLLVTAVFSSGCGVRPTATTGNAASPIASAPSNSFAASLTPSPALNPSVVKSFAPLTLLTPAEGTFTLRRTGWEASTETRTVTRTAHGFIEDVRGVKTVHSVTSVAVEADGLYLTSEHVISDGKIVENCSPPQPVLFWPSPLQPNATWTVTFPACTGVLGAPPASIEGRLAYHVEGVTQIQLDGKAVPVVRLDVTGVLTGTPATVVETETVQGTQFVDPARGVVLRDAEHVVSTGQTLDYVLEYTTLPPVGS